MVIAGSSGRIPDYLKDLIRQNEKHIYICPKIDLSEFPNLYRSAEALLFPSLYEGFGFPVLEAQACGCPVFSSNASVLPEVLKNSAFYFDPKDNEYFRKILLEKLNNASEKQEIIDKGIDNSKKFNWTDSVQQLLKVYEKYSSQNT